MERNEGPIQAPTWMHREARRKVPHAAWVQVCETPRTNRKLTETGSGSAGRRRGGGGRRATATTGSAVSFSGDSHVLGLGSSDTCRDRKPLRRPRQMRDCLGSDTRPESGSRERGIARGRRPAGGESRGNDCSRFHGRRDLSCCNHTTSKGQYSLAIKNSDTMKTEGREISAL